MHTYQTPLHNSFSVIFSQSFSEGNNGNNLEGRRKGKRGKAEKKSPWKRGKKKAASHGRIR
jgi:hypothetical protein